MCLLLQRFTGKAKMKVMLMKGYDLGRQKEQACFLKNTSKTDKGTFWWCTCLYSRSFPSSGVVELNGRNTLFYRCATKIFLWRPSLSKKQHLGKNNYDIKRQDKGWFVFFFFFCLQRNKGTKTYYYLPKHTQEIWGKTMVLQVYLIYI